jgi:hypothetical protein
MSNGCRLINMLPSHTGLTIVHEDGHTGGHSQPLPRQIPEALSEKWLFPVVG